MNKLHLLKAPLLGAVLSGALAAMPAMAEDFHALSQLSTRLTAMSEDQLISIEGGTNDNNYSNYQCNFCANIQTQTVTVSPEITVSPTIQANVGTPPI
jgi:hypothetical protein